MTNPSRPPRNAAANATPEKRRKRPGPPPNADYEAMFESYGIDALCDEIKGGVAVYRIAARFGVSDNSLWSWIARDPGRSARVLDARREGAQAYEERAEKIVQAAKNKFGLSKARELAHHYRWRASLLNPHYRQQQAPAADPPEEALESVLKALGERLPN